MTTPRRTSPAGTAVLGLVLLVGCGGTLDPSLSTEGQPTVSPDSTEAGTVTTTAQASATGSTMAQVAWSVQEAGGGTVSASGLYTAPGAPGTYHVVVRSASDPTKTATAVVTVTAAPAGGGATPMEIISRSVPVTASSGTAAWGQDENYDETHHWAGGSNGWLAYDLSGVPAEKRAAIYVSLWFGGNTQQQLNVGAIGGGGVPPVGGVPGSYVLQGATSASGPWTTLASVSGLRQASRVHFLAGFSAYTWLRYSSPNATNLKMDVYDASGGVTDGFVFFGDSISSNIFQGDDGGIPGLAPNFISRAIHVQRPSAFPVVVGGGIAFMTSMDARDLIVNGTGGFATAGVGPLVNIYAPVKYAVLVYGANDAGAGTLDEAGFLQANSDIINAFLAKGSNVVIATPTWATDSARQANLRKLLGVIGLHANWVPAWAATTYSTGSHILNGGKVYRCTTAGSSVSGPSGSGSGIADGGTARWQYVPSIREAFATQVAAGRVLAGADLYSTFLNQSGWLGDGLHPNDVGEQRWADAWVAWALSNLYK